MKNKLMFAALAAMAVAALGSATGLICTVRAVREFERKNGVRILFPKSEKRSPEKAKEEGHFAKYTAKEGEDIVSIAIQFAVSPSQIRKLNGYGEGYAIKPGDEVLLPLSSETEAAPAPRGARADATQKPATSPRKTAPSPMKVTKVAYDGKTEVEVFLSERPDMENARRYVEVSPLNEGAFGLRYRAYGNEPRLVVTGDFAHRTNVTLRIRKGLPVYGGAQADLTGARSLAKDFVHVFQRNDLDPRVAFADKGRYLPPMGSRSISVESVNVSKIHTEIRRVEPSNIVQLLAREEDV
ncbi:MAG: LysM peptidoglycan-binding domain-containing protein [Kiritimatiellae bacterium]|nr:LysM peptidoglycan-binding domain-containing protein [Kiritimatiellia bacterium]